MMMNPVLRREVQTSLRGFKLYAVLTAYTTIAAGIAGLFLWGTSIENYIEGFHLQNTFTLYILLCCAQFMLVLLTAPALTAGSISGEREKQTLDLLLITKMSPFSIVTGKLFSSLSVIILSSFAVLPVFAVMFYFGSVSFYNLFVMTLYFISVACMLGSIAIFFSCVFKKTVISAVMTYLISGFLCGGTGIVFFLYVVIYMGIFQTEPSVWSIVFCFVANPSMGFASLLDAQLHFGMAESIGTLASYEIQNPFSKALFSFVVEHFWVFNVLFNSIVTVLFLLLAAKCINPLKKR